MKELYCFHLDSNQDVDAMWNALEDQGIEVIYSTEEDDGACIYGYADNKTLPQFIEGISSIKPTDLPKIDWEDQWKQHGHNFQDGYVHVNLSLFGAKEEIIRLEPGPGFGDLSHPTTHLVLRLMAKYVPLHEVVDIGCGSGVLTLSAIGMGAPFAYGIDIDPHALNHAYQNAVLNGMSDKCHFCLPLDFNYTGTDPVAIVINMIFSEQKEAFKMLPQLDDRDGFLIASGIREEEKNEYVKYMEEKNWFLKDKIEEGGWAGFLFKR